MQLNKSLVNQAGQIAGTPLMDPEKNPELAEQASAVIARKTTTTTTIICQKHYHTNQNLQNCNNHLITLTPEEQDSLAVGEKLQAEQEGLLAGKYKSAEELEKAYIELQKETWRKEEKRR